jgi:hypothetical protein
MQDRCGNPHRGVYFCLRLTYIPAIPMQDMNR